MGRLLAQAEKGTKLTAAEADQLILAFYRAPIPVTIVNGTISVSGSGCYSVATENGAAEDALTSVLFTDENLVGATIELQAANTGQVVIVTPGASMKLLAGEEFRLATIYSWIRLKHYGSGVMVERGRGQVA